MGSHKTLTTMQGTQDSHPSQPMAAPPGNGGGSTGGTSIHLPRDMTLQLNVALPQLQQWLGVDGDDRKRPTASSAQSAHVSVPVAVRKEESMKAGATYQTVTVKEL